jgi:hypothetical protein
MSHLWKIRRDSMDKLVTIDGDNNNEATEKQAKIFDRYLRGEINKEDCECILKEIQDEENRQIKEELAAIRADAEGEV